MLATLTKKGFQTKLVFLDADENTIMRRYNQTRRHYPLDHSGGLLEAVMAEKDRMTPVKQKADYVIDTSHQSVHELKFAVFNIAQKLTAVTNMAINIISFGFKYGAPPEADLLIDVRFLTNPYFIPKLKSMNGESKEINDFVMNDDNARMFLNRYADLLDWLIPLYEKEGKAYLNIAIGCTGGQHRSVVVARAIFDHIKHQKASIRLIHRDIQYN